METAAAILVQTLLDSNDELQKQLTAAANPQAAAEFLRPWYQAMFVMIKSAEDFDQTSSMNAPRA
jgi:hypothetical protein